jgi:hypothetical protein
MPLQPHHIGLEAVAALLQSGNGVLPVLDVLLRHSAPVVVGDDALSRAGQVGPYEADARILFARMPLDLCHRMMRHCP